MNFMDTKEKLKKNGISLDDAEIKELCEKYHLTELAVFGSALVYNLIFSRTQYQL